MSGKATSFNSEPQVNSGSKFDHYIVRNRNTRIAGIASSVVLLVLSTLLVYPIVRNLSNVEAATPTNSTTTLSIATGASANVELLVRDSSGTFASSTASELLSFGVTTNNYAGYELKLLGKDSTYNTLSYKNGSSTIGTLTSIASSGASSTFSNGKWGYTLKKGETPIPSSGNYLPAPNNTTGYIIEKTTTPNASVSNNYTLGLGVKADYSTPAGTYTNTYVLTAIGNGTPYTIYYRDATGDSTVSGLPSTQEEATSSINVPLSTAIPTRTGYTFSRWCDGTVTNNGTTCSGTTYNPGANIGIDRTAASNVTTLYAVWTVKSYTINITNTNTTSTPASSTTINFKGSTTITVTPTEGYYLSEVTCPTGYTCSGYETGSDSSAAAGSQTVTLTNGNGGSGSSATGTDAGGTVEFVGESAGSVTLQDFTADECSAMATDRTKTLIDVRDNNSYKITKLGDGRCWMTQNLRYMGDTVGSTSTTSTWYLKSATSNVNADKTMSMTDLNSNSPVDYNTYDYAKFHKATDDQVPSGADYTAEDMGVWYNYAAASAMTITGSSNTTNATQDICPKGWRLPTDSEQSGITSQTSTYSPVTGGRYRDGDFYNTSVGRWWSATSGDSTNRYLQAYNGSNLDTDYGDRLYGYYVRCIKN